MKNTILVKTISELREHVCSARAAGKSVGLVPTMGALHAGHASLIKTAAEQTDFVVVSIFVNPTQFGPTEDFGKYPRTIDSDMQICRENGADIVFNPDVNEMYARPQMTWVDVEGLTGGLCGKSRPGHFRGVATVCSKLFNIVGADVAFFGQKDAQQAIVIKRMVADLNFPLKIVVCPTIREQSGLAMSSRNKYLTDDQKRDAVAIYQSLMAAKDAIRAGNRQVSDITGLMHEFLGRTGRFQIEYISIVDADTLQDVEAITGEVLIAIAAKIGTTRLIDNILLDARDIK